VNLRYVELESLVRSILGADHATQLSVEMIINDACRSLYRMHQWNFRHSREIGIGLVASQNWAPLPLDFGEMLTIRGAGARSVSMVSVEEIGRFRGRQADWTGTADVQCAIAYDGNGRPVLELYPTPSAAESPGLYITYSRDWQDMSESHREAVVPPIVRPLIAEIVVAYAKGKKADQLGEYLQRFEASLLVLRAKEADGLIQSDYGPITGGLADRPRMVRGDVGTLVESDS
jgi:hypothetical protein